MRYQTYKWFILLVTQFAWTCSLLAQQETPLKLVDQWGNKNPPFSFKFNGETSESLFKNCALACDTKTNQEYLLDTIRYNLPSGLVVRCERKKFKDYPAEDWVVYFENTGKEDTPIIENIQALDCRLPGTEENNFILHYSNGSQAKASDFTGYKKLLSGKRKKIEIGSMTGRASDPYLPFFNLQGEEGGLVMAVGWSGTWQAVFERPKDAAVLSIRAGMPGTHLKLHPGERIRTPRILLLEWKGKERITGQNLFRRLLLAHYIPRIDGKPVQPPVAYMYFKRDASAEEAMEKIKQLPSQGIDTFWMDAGWFGNGRPYTDEAGNWFPRQKDFPDGLRPLGDLCHQLGMKFMVWFEPERVAPGTRIEKEHPEWLIPDQKNGEPGSLFDLGIPEARKWLTDLISNQIQAGGIDIYRNDFNKYAPAQCWQSKDQPDRKGITECHYIEGLYQFWSELLRRHPGLMIDNCASGGRRIDLETMSLSLPLWQVDGFPAAVSFQVHNEGLNYWIPLHGTSFGWTDKYSYRSSMNAGTVFYGVSNVAPITAAIKKYRDYYKGDYYPLFEMNKTDHLETIVDYWKRTRGFPDAFEYSMEDFKSVNPGKESWGGYQLDRPDIGAGMVFIFRREASPYPTAEIELKALQPDAMYELTDEDTGEIRKDLGNKLARQSIAISNKPGSILFLYKKINP